MKIKNVIISLGFIAASASCNSILCGTPKEEWKKLYDNASKKYKDVVKVRYIPCESIYIDVLLKRERIDTSELKALHNTLYDSDKKIGWQTIRIYDSDGNYLYSHSYNGNISVQHGD